MGLSSFFSISCIALLQQVEERPANGVKGGRVHQELRIFIYEEFEEESEHETYEQLFPVEVPYGAGGVSGKITLMSGCKWRKKDPTLPASLAFPLLPQEDDPRDPPRRDPPPRNPPPFWDPPPPMFPDPWKPQIPNYYATPQPLTLTMQFNPMTTNIKVGSGSVFNAAALNTQGTQISNQPEGGVVVTPGNPPQPPPPPPPTKGIFGGSDSDEGDDTDTPLLVGPEFALPLKADVTEWEHLGWMPEATNLCLYGHALFGEMRIFDSSVDVSLYGVGPRFGLPIVREGWLLVDALLSVGPAFLHTDIGDTVGLNFATGLGAQLKILGSLSFRASAEFRGYFAPDVNAHGPSFNLGLNMGW